VNDDIHSLIGAYAVDALTETERTRFEQHLSACEHCRTELIGLQAAASELGAASTATPPAALRADILQQIDAVRPLPPVVPEQEADAGESTGGRDIEGDSPATATPIASARARHTVRRWVAAAAAAAALVIGGLAWHPWTSTQQTVSATQQVLHAPDAQRFVKHLGPTTATVVRSKSLDESVLVAKDMAPAPAGHVYQLWYQTPSGHMKSAGLMPKNPSGSRQTVLLRGNARSATAVGITVEPAGGSKQPTTKPIALFSFST